MQSAMASWADQGIEAAESAIVIRGGDYLAAREPYYGIYYGTSELTEEELLSQGYYKLSPEDKVLWRDVTPAVVEEWADQQGTVETGRILLWSSEESVITWRFTVPESGIYELYVTYVPITDLDGEVIGKGASIQRDIKIDGRYPFREAMNVLFSRTWTDAEIREEKRFDALNNQVRPKPLEVIRWSTVACEDGDATYDHPLQFYLQAGQHTLEMQALREPMAVSKLVFRAPQTIPTYAEVNAQYESAGHKPVWNREIKWQGEDALYRSHTTVRMEYHSYPTVEPAGRGNIVFNAFGDWRWRDPHQWAEWEFDVPETGLYRIGMKVQGWPTFAGGLPSNRAIMIDGRIPFAELQSYPIENTQGWWIETLGYYESEEARARSEKTPYLFYLTEGKHTLRMSVVMGEAGETIRKITTLMSDITDIVNDVRMLVGLNPDPRRDYSVHKSMPNLLDRMQAIADVLEEERKRVVELTSQFPPIAGTMEEIITEIRDMIERPESIPIRLDSMAEKTFSLASMQQELKQQPVVIDYFLVTSTDREYPDATASVFQHVEAAFRSFYSSFFKDYNRLTDDASKAGIPPGKVIDVWVGLGREWATIMREMIEDSFTPETGIYVNINLVPSSGLGTVSSPVMMAAVARRAPDVVVGLPGNLPVEYAIRGALEPLDDKPGFEEVAKRFSPGSLTPFEYQGHTYALPQRQNMLMMFVRTDILDMLGLDPPQTWDDVYRIIPELKETGKEFYYPSTSLGSSTSQTGSSTAFAPILYQNGGDFYTPDGLRSALDTPEGLAAFEKWATLYTHYKLERAANAYMRFRIGDMPIIVSDYMLYVTLYAAAPELANRWTMLPIPGVLVEDENGVRIDRSTSGDVEAVILFNQEHVDGPDLEGRTESGWKFIEWWTRDETQARFGAEIEAYLGPEARWNTANIEAMKQLPWRQKDKDAMLAQAEWFRQPPVVLGGYFTERHLTNAWNRVVLQGWKVRDALDEAVEYINRELQKKQQEFGISSEQPEAVLR